MYPLCTHLVYGARSIDGAHFAVFLVQFNDWSGRLQVGLDPASIKYNRSRNTSAVIEVRPLGGHELGQKHSSRYPAVI